jgi:hypothetical protein
MSTMVLAWRMSRCVARGADRFSKKGTSENASVAVYLSVPRTSRANLRSAQFDSLVRRGLPTTPTEPPPCAATTSFNFSEAKRTASSHVAGTSRPPFL